MLYEVITPTGNEDRVLVRLDEVPNHLVQALLATEDRNFFSHYGVDPRGIARAVVVITSYSIHYTKLYEVGITARERGESTEEAEKFLLREVPLGKVITPEAIADLAVFLASSRAGLISGTAINVDGGRTRSI